MEYLIERLETAKHLEQVAKERRIEAENAIIEALGFKEDGSQTHKIGAYSVTIKGVINRTLNAEIWESIKSTVPEALRPVVYKPALDVKGLKYIQTHEPGLYNIISQAVTSKPGKTSVTLKKKEQND